MAHFSVSVFSDSPEQARELLDRFCADWSAESPYTVFFEDEDEEVDEVTGKRGYWENPDSRYDGFTIGGRWYGKLKLLPGRCGERGECPDPEWAATLEPDRCDIALAADCDFAMNREWYERAERFWAFAAEGDSRVRDDDGEEWEIFTPIRPERYQREFGSKENFARYQAQFSTAAFISADGKWYRGEHKDLFGNGGFYNDMDREYEAAYNRALEEARARGQYITIADCHF